MNRFATLLNDIDARLDLHQPAKGRILLEIAADIEDLFDHHLANGMDEAEAQRAVEEDFDFSDEVLAELVDLHQTRYQGFMDRLSEQAQNRWERGGLALLVLLMAISGGPILAESDLFRVMNPVTGLILCIAVVGLILGMAIFHRLFIQKEKRTRRWRRGLPLLAALSVTSLVLSMFGFSVGLYLALRRLIFRLDEAWPIVIDWLIRAIPIVLFGLLTAMVMALIWFVMVNRIRKLEQTELEYLLTP